MTAPYLPPCPLGCDAEGHVPSCARFSAAHDAPGTWPPVGPDSPFAEGADDDPEMPGRCRDAADDCPWCEDGFVLGTGVLCRTCHGTGGRDYGEPVSDEHDVNADEDFRPDRRDDVL